MSERLKYDYLVIEGNIGTGKTSLATRIAEQFQARIVLERFADNPFLPKFYENSSRYAFPLELSFLADRYQQLNDEVMPQELFRQQTVADYVLSKSLIFASITLKEDEFQLYQRLFHIINPHLPKPDLLVYLHKDVPKLKENIRNRGRDYEQNIQDDYLGNLEKGYWDFFKQQEGLRIVVLDTNEVDFVHNMNDYNRILEILQQDFPVGLHRILPKG
ncbi:MAG: deoxynucleoside kinase [Bacteroidota bacterium]|jgi:deoxyadenosine/deoxycytidine kinase|uniref:deoxynucleoside kinase n=1 Tax=Candidatus Pollutiaquabacter sp. TaxID=3416354 RepID=UPI001A5ECDB7|nr:deoxynucleoside kinase [Bacteroidota bacterium]MBL7948034.1 deoxynucleoside kinase [Bacteroidia bacterium]MBP7269847.1 deoxynucleoside kinase [Bacteroidia bacterium]MBP7436153.1 deoxynucleoside kinase [Bacteroidia bacterium]MBP7728885.1 deoxynucleoside kinase [Bacteroidia bacterium]